MEDGVKKSTKDSLRLSSYSIKTGKGQSNTLELGVEPKLEVMPKNISIELKKKQEKTQSLLSRNKNRIYRMEDYF